MTTAKNAKPTVVESENIVDGELVTEASIPNQGGSPESNDSIVEEEFSTAQKESFLGKAKRIAKNKITIVGVAVVAVAVIVVVAAKSRTENTDSDEVSEETPDA